MADRAARKVQHRQGRACQFREARAALAALGNCLPLTEAGVVMQRLPLPGWRILAQYLAVGLLESRLMGSGAEMPCTMQRLLPEESQLAVAVLVGGAATIRSRVQAALIRTHTVAQIL